MPKITIRSTRRLRQQQIIASLLANNRTVVSPHASPRLERHLRQKMISSNNSIASLKALRLREVSFEDSLSPSTSSSSSEGTFESVITSRDRDGRDRSGSCSSTTSLSMHSRKRTRCSLSSLSPSVCLSSLADDGDNDDTTSSSSENLSSHPSSSKYHPSHTTPILEHKLSSGNGGGWGHFVDVVPPDNDDNDGTNHEGDRVSPLPQFWSPFENKAPQSPRSFSLSSSPFAHSPYSLKRHYVPECSSSRYAPPHEASPHLTATISMNASESSSSSSPLILQDHHGATVEKALSVMSIS